MLRCDIESLSELPFCIELLVCIGEDDRLWDRDCDGD